VFWQFIGLCRAKHIAVVDASVNDLSDSLQGRIRGMLAEMEHSKIVKHLADGKRLAREKGKRVDGRGPYGEHPLHEYDREREVVARVRQMNAEDISSYRIALTLNTGAIVTRTGSPFKVTTHAHPRAP
jgi:DNA invertase Pin-like site-specific DNA recombinase